MAVDCLSRLTPCRADDYYDWLRVGMALHAGGASCAEWDTWSQQSAKYQPGACAAKWATFGMARGGIGVGTLVHMATEDSGPRAPNRQSAPALRALPAGPAPIVRTSARDTIGGAKMRGQLISRGGGLLDDADAWESSPVRLDWPPEHDSFELLERLYAPDDLLFIGCRTDASQENVKPAAEWATLLRQRVKRYEAITDPVLRPCSRQLVDHQYAFIMPNPHTGHPGAKTNGMPSWRCDANVAAFRYAVAEIDSVTDAAGVSAPMPKDQQLGLLRGLGLPIAALIDTGGKSIHAWLAVNATDVADWTHWVERDLFANLARLGVDGACRNESHLSRLPGLWRFERATFQRLVWLADTANGRVLA